ncbi:hypothetical protein ACHAWU_008420 [Discostella pseudostelligera]|uniref:Transmembrane protein n=1 Tax=Discostella pseudostelligera TaxID=259834 RepID=A0ABD3M3E6_9STRA
MKSSTSSKSKSSPTAINLYRLIAKIFDLHLPYLTTTLHLQIEFVLWICTILFIISSSLVLYKQTYLQTWGDWVFLLTVGAWLGRHFLLRLVCTVTWMDPGLVKGGSWRRRRAFHTWLLQHRRQQNLYHRLRWLLSSISPYNIASMLVKFIQTCAMAGQYCDASAANGVASAAMMVVATSGGGDDHYLHGHHFSKSSSTHHSHGQHAAVLSFGPRPHSITMNTYMLSLARSWGTLCGLSFATWSLLRGERGNMRGAIGEIVVLVGVVIWSWTKSCLSLVGLPPFSSSPRSELRSGFGLDSSMGGVVTGNTGKRNRSRKQSTHADLQSHSSSQNRNNFADADRSLDFGHGNLTFSSFPSAIRSRALHIQQMRTSDMYRALESIWEACPPSQFLVAMIATITLIFGWLIALGGYDLFFGNSYGANDIEYQNMPNFKGSINLNQQHDLFHKGYYWRNQSPFPAPNIFNAEPPSFVTLIFLVVSFGTAASLLLYGRILLPIPEFVAGTNVLKALRAETRMLGGGTSGVGASKLSKLKDLPWAENYKSITTENRLRLYYKVAIVRVLENVLLCAVLPQTEIVCRITEHCEQGPLLWGPSGVTGIAGRRFGKRSSFLTSSFDALMGDDFATRLIATSVVLVTAILLVGQMTLMNRTYLAIMGYISGEWELVAETSEGQEDDLFVSPTRFRPKSLPFELFGIGSKPIQSHATRRSNILMQWDPKRRYQKGDRIAYGDAMYEAVSNSPEGPPFDPFLRAAHDLFSEELGHPSASNLMPSLSQGILVLAGMVLTAVLVWRKAGWNYVPLVVCFAATLIAGYGVSHSTEKSMMGMKKVALEIARSSSA